MKIEEIDNDLPFVRIELTKKETALLISILGADYRLTELYKKLNKLIYKD